MKYKQTKMPTRCNCKKAIWQYYHVESKFVYPKISPANSCGRQYFQ